MVVGILQFDLLIHGAESLKDKRRVVLSVKDRLRRDFHVSVAEISALDSMHVARMGLALVGNDGKHIGAMLDRVTAELRALHDAELGETSRELLYGTDIAARGGESDELDAVNEEMLRRAEERPGEGVT